MLQGKLDNHLIEKTKSSSLTELKIENDGINYSAGAVGEKIWMGRITANRNVKSEKKHHNDSDTVHYILSGSVTFYVGEGYKQKFELNKGDFIYIPPYHTYYFENNSHKNQSNIITTMAPIQQEVVLTDACDLSELNKAEKDILYIRGSELNEATNQTRNMPRKTAIQAPNLWIGRVTGAPLKDSGAHHHGESETAGFIISGNTEILFGDGYETLVELTEGDFLRVPPFLPHIERNNSETVPVEFLTARNPRNIVENLN
ncbi:cupin domain-containing protein [Cytobacillus kochii]|uniref:cupin domain-containing protein n=1 Tax=Cytobacillus kochii TaxID=859143 RepID=UPI002E22FE21|nr:cupin domain-containing protein [Cytobacillus kochii]